VTNAREGDIFTNPAQILANNDTLADYIANLLPRLNSTSIQQAVALYDNIPGNNTVPEQAALVMGDSMCTLICFKY
jgi:hypothetical protein